jgi:hypothetical protein
MSYNPNAGNFSHFSLFTFGHTSGTQSTGALGFTPKLAFYVANTSYGGSGGDAASSVGYAIGATGNARACGLDAVEGPGAPQLPGFSGGQDSAAIGGLIRAIQNTVQNSSFDRRLQVSAFSAAGISLTWDVAVNSHQGHLLVIG